MSPLVSIVIPCYNAARWLGAALDSALAQTWPHLEIIVVNDGSRDDSLHIAQSYAARGVAVIDQPNAGQCAACNRGLAAARGDYIKFFDADDILSPEHVALQVAALAGRPGAVAYAEWARFHDDPANARFVPRAGWHDAAPADWLVEIWRDGQPMMQCGQFLIARAILERTGGWDEELSLVNDFEFFARVVLASDGVVFTSGARLYYRSNLPGSLSARRDARAWRSAFLSHLRGTEHLLRREDSPRTRAACAAMLQTLVYDMYPSTPNLVRQLEERIAALGGTDLKAKGGRTFLRLRRLLGWKLARRLQIWSGKLPAPAS